MIITFLPINKKVQAEENKNLLQVAREAGIDLGGNCAGNKTCGKCKVLITKGNSRDYTTEELKILTDDERNAGMRLACCYQITQDICVIVSKSNAIVRSIKSANTIPSHIEEINDRLGVAFDIGTTTVAAQLWNLDKKELLGEVSTLNPQTQYGADVITRISYANQDTRNLQMLSKIIRDCCNDMINNLSGMNHIKPLSIDSVVIAANTTMSHLFLGKSVEHLAKVPFQGVSYQGELCDAGALGIHIKPHGKVFVMPGIGGYVGSDTVGCIIARDMTHLQGNNLMIDIGTNGEMVLSRNGKITACSTAAGPAFEGATLYQGMRAEDGAITKVVIVNDKISVDYIGAEKTGVYPVGICGSGVIEAISEIYDHHRMDETGRLLKEAGEVNYITLWSKNNKQVILTQKDIREFQLAKAAIYTGTQLLLEKENITFSQLDKIYLAGSFGSSINIKKAIHIGLLPDIELERIEYIGNGSLLGASKVLIGDRSVKETEQIGVEAEHFELALCEDFQQVYLSALAFPHKIDQ